VNVLHVNTHDVDGGAARAVYRLHRSLLLEGVNSQMLVQSKSSDDFSVIGPTTKIQKGLGKLRPTLDSIPVWRYKNRTKTLFSPAWVPFSSVVAHINGLNPDLVHLHWVAGGMMRIEDIARIKAPIVWSLHDNWAFTGGCHIMWDCSRYQKNCGKCPRLGSDSYDDLSRKVMARKKKNFPKVRHLTVVSLSSWLHECAVESALFKDRKNVCLPNPIDAKKFSPVNRGLARELLNLPQDQKLILFGAMSSTSDINKGYEELVSALNQLQRYDVELVVFGSSQPQNGSEFSQPSHYLGRLHDDVTLRVLYSAADVMVVPSFQEAFGQTAVEAMACGTPVVAFGATGLLDIVDHKENGYLAKPFEPADLAHGIEWVLNHANYNQLCENARRKVVQHFDYKVVAPKYIELYRSVLEKEAS
jgi:glycosyltransferase involved in cell wall biosynthesis